MERRDKIILRKILEEIQVALLMTGDCSLDSFLQNEMLKRAAGMTLINIGELVKTLSFSVRQTWPDVPWKAIAGFRDVAAHKYQSLRMEDVYETVTGDLPVLKNRIEEILSGEGK